MIRIYSLAFLLFAAFVVFSIWDSPYHSQQDKLMWTGIVIFFPGVGILFWLLYGRRNY
ncbi:MAG: PLDc N-terminal domain-containing protein [Bacteroidota bacterium]